MSKSETSRQPGTRCVLPGSAVGVLGSGQLGRMFAIAARRMGYRVHTFSPDTDTPTGQVADVEVVADYEDLDAVRAFARGVSVVTFEFENVPFASASAAAEVAPVRPAGEVLHITQHRLREKTWLSAHGFPVAPFRSARSADETAAALTTLGPAAIVKTAGWGYDGKGQVRVDSPAAAAQAFRSLGADEVVIEKLIPFDLELSVIVARGLDGSLADWGTFENRHVGGILDLTVHPARVSPELAAAAQAIARDVANAIGLVGVLCVEFFALGSQLLINELAPRPHNSGHLTFDFSVTSQFEQQLRAVCGLPLGETTWLPQGATAMAQLLGDIWPPPTSPHSPPPAPASPYTAPYHDPNWAAALADPAVKLHLYGKHQPRPGRKMGHLSLSAPTPEEAVRRVLQARNALAAPVAV